MGWAWEEQGGIAMSEGLRLGVLSCLLAASVWTRAAQPASDLRSALEAHLGSHQREIVNELVDLVSIPNVVSDAENFRGTPRIFAACSAITASVPRCSRPTSIRSSTAS